MPYPSSGTSNRSLNDIAEEPSAPIVTKSVIGRKTADFTNAHIATYTNLTTRNICVSSNHLDLTVDPKPLSNKNRHLHHPYQSESPIREDSKQENPLPPLPPRLPHHLLAEKSPRTKEKGRRNNIIPENKGKPKSIEPSMTSRGNGIEEWRNSPNSKTNPTNMTTKPSATSTMSHLDFKSSWKFRIIDGG